MHLDDDAMDCLPEIIARTARPGLAAQTAISPMTPTDASPSPARTGAFHLRRYVWPVTRDGNVLMFIGLVTVWGLGWATDSFWTGFGAAFWLCLVVLAVRVVIVLLIDCVAVLRRQSGMVPVKLSDDQLAPAAAAASGPPDPSELYLNVAGANEGPYSLGEVRVKLASGAINAADYAWKEGWMGWRKIADLAEFQLASPAPGQTVVNHAVPISAASPPQSHAGSTTQPTTDTGSLEELRDYCAECQTPIQFPKCLAGTQTNCTACGMGMRLLAPLHASQLGAAFLVLIPFLIVFPRTVFVAGFCLACILVALVVLNPQLKVEVLSLTPSNILVRLPLIGKLLALTIRSPFKSLGSASGAGQGSWTTLLNSPVSAGWKPQRGLLAGSVLLILSVTLYFLVPMMLSQWKRSNEANEQRKAEQLRQIQAAKEASDPVMAERTAEAWRQIQAIEVRVGNASNPQSMMMMLAQLDLNHVDPLLVAHVAKIAELSRGSSQLLASLQADVQAKQASQARVGEALAAVGAVLGALGSGNARNLDEFGRNMSVGRQVGELAGQVGNAIDGVQADKQLAAKYQGPLQYYQTAFSQLAQDRNALGNHFSEKYRRPFLSFQ